MRDSTAAARGALFILALLVSVVVSGHALGAEPCETCHRYRGLAVSGKELWIHSQGFAASPHAGLLCSDCHKGCSIFPHEKDATTGCALPCHVPGEGHERIAKAVEAGPHRTLMGTGKPPCLGCHDARGAAQIIKAGSDSLCLGCHTRKAAERAYYPDTIGSFGDSAHASLGSRKPGCSACHQNHAPGAQSARKSCARNGCHEGSSKEFSQLFDHRGGNAQDTFWGAGKWLLLLVGLVLATFLLKGS